MTRAPTTIQPLQPNSPWVALATDSAAWAATEPNLLDSMLTSMVLIRAFEEKVLELAGQGLVHGPAHSAIGQEGGATGSVLAMRGSDQINGSHRAHHQFLAKALHYVAPHGLASSDPFNDDVRTIAYRALSEILGLARGYCKGRGGSMHLRWAESGNLGTNAIVGGGVPAAAGAAWAHKRAGTGDVAFTYFGDGAVNIGSVLETMNLAAAWKLPLCFFIENNRYAVSTTVEEATAEPRLSSRGLAFGIPAWKVDGMDPLAVYLATKAAVEKMRAGEGQTIIEADVYRYFHQNGPLPGSAFGYRSKGEEKAWRERDPIDRVAAEMAARQLIGKDQVAALRVRAKGLMEEVAAELVEQHEGKRRIVPSLWPSPDFRDFGVRGDLGTTGRALLGAGGFSRRDRREPVRRHCRRCDGTAHAGRRGHHRDGRGCSSSEGRHQWCYARIVGQFPRSRIGNAHCRERICRFGRRHSHGRPLRTRRRVHVSRFLWVAADQVFNQIGKARHMFGGDGECRSYCAPRWPWARVTARSIRWTPPASSPRRLAGGSSPPQRHTITWA